MKKLYNRNEINAAREAKLDEIRKEQASQKEKNFAENQKSWNRDFVRGLMGLAVVFASTTVVTGLSFPAATSTILTSLFASYLVIAGTTVFYSNISSYDTDKVKLAAKKIREIEDKNRSENRDITRSDIIRLKREAKWLEIRDDSYKENTGIKNIRLCIKEKESSLRESSPSRQALAKKLRPGLMDRLCAEKELVNQ